MYSTGSRLGGARKTGRLSSDSRSQLGNNPVALPNLDLSADFQGFCLCNRLRVVGARNDRGRCSNVASGIDGEYAIFEQLRPRFYFGSGENPGEWC